MPGGYPAERPEIQWCGGRRGVGALSRGRVADSHTDLAGVTRIVSVPLKPMASIDRRRISDVNAGAAMPPFSEFIVYVDESGDHSLTTINREFPLFVLTFCVFRKEEYVTRIVPALQGLKFKTFGHDMVVMHEREIRKAEGPFTFLTDATRRGVFMTDLNTFAEDAPMTIIAVVIRKAALAKKAADAENLYHFALRSGLECLDGILCAQHQHEPLTHIVFEARGKKEDAELELEFRRICDGANHRSERLNFQIIIADKQINSTGLQLADLTARPIGRYVLNPTQPNRAYEIIKKKLYTCPMTGRVDGFGMKCYPESE